ncbi:MAG TPA: ligase-associated DNA damage response exonuclease [Gemmatimonadales bacterium]|nr:ligase-associated DNA damage response exonuclease [Gemmatimonadales bacterium]
MSLLRLTREGLYCEAGDFHIDAWGPVSRVVVTHGHGDHLAWNCGAYLTAAEGAPVLAARLPAGSRVDSLPYGATTTIGGVRVSLHPAGHILGSAQVRVERQGEVWVVSGDYKTEPDPTCAPFEPVRCHTFITESTFGLPIYRWPAEGQVVAEINRWWAGNASLGRTSLLYGYALGKAQRLIAQLDPSIGPIITHGAVERMNAVYRAAGVPLPPTEYAGLAGKREVRRAAIVVAPPGADASPWARRFAPSSNAFASGWMRVRGARRRRSLDRGFTLSDHADWPGLLAAIEATGASRVWVTHGYTAVLTRWLSEHGIEARAVATRFEGERDEPDASGEAGADQDG